jgi:HD-GYP domain-containing protein (c-di-GMP phosphodiesterase class II)
MSLKSVMYYEGAARGVKLSSRVGKGNYTDLLKSITKAAVTTTYNEVESLSNALRIISDSFDSNMCAIFQMNQPQDFQFLCGYKCINLDYAENIMKLKKSDAEESILLHEVIYSSINNASILYFVPLISEKTLGVMVIELKKELDALGAEILEAIGGIIASSVDRIALKQQLDNHYNGTVESLVAAIKAKDVYTQGHSQRVADYSRIIGTYLKLKDEEIRELEITGLVHDIGKIGVSDNILGKSDSLTDTEYESIKLHPVIGSNILKPLGVPENVMLGTLLHHKRYDLKGYPFDVQVDKLPLVPAIIGVADAYDAMTSERSYRKIMSKTEAINELKKFKGTQFDPDIVDIVEELVFLKKL